MTHRQTRTQRLRYMHQTWDNAVHRRRVRVIPRMMKRHELCVLVRSSRGTHDPLRLDASE